MALFHRIQTTMIRRRAVFSLVSSHIKACQRRSYSSSTAETHVFPVFQIATDILAEKHALVQDDISRIEKEVSAATDSSRKQELESRLLAKRLELGHMEHHQQKVEVEGSVSNFTLWRWSTVF